MAGQDEPRLRGARPVRDQKADVLGRVAGNVQHLGGHVSERQHVAVARAVKLGRGLGAGKEDIFRAGGFRQAPSCGEWSACKCVSTT